MAAVSEHATSLEVEAVEIKASRPCCQIEWEVCLPWLVDLSHGDTTEGKSHVSGQARRRRENRLFGV